MATHQLARRPYWILEGIEPNGQVQFGLPPDASSGHYLCVGLTDWLGRPERWNYRAVSKIQGCGVDTTHLMSPNVRVNIGCAPNARCLGCKEYGNGETDPEKLKALPPICRRWATEGRNWRTLWDREKGKTALILSPGPHLMEKADEIRELAKDRDHYFTIGFSRVLFSGLPLHYYTTLERRSPAKMDTTRCRYPETTLIAATTAHWGMCQCFPASKRYFGEAFVAVTEEGRWIDSGMERVTIALGNIAPDSIMQAYRLGARNFYLYGFEGCCTQEMATAPDGSARITVGKYYYDMSVDDPHLKFYGIADGKYFPARGIDGELYATNFELYETIAYAEATCEMLRRQQGCTFEDRTKRGMNFMSWVDPEVVALKAKVAELEDKLAWATGAKVGPTTGICMPVSCIANGEVNK